MTLCHVCTLVSCLIQCRRVTAGLLVPCRDQEQQAEGPAAQQDLTKLADDLVQKFEDQWKAAAENLEAASKAFDNLEGAAYALMVLPEPILLQHVSYPARVL